ncbi:MAG TPA: helix-turn-helix domain-containing protein, partial [Terriglobia bacterium]|nr:helix-turn-helix domain-containing protein [Terriglobia bacterium]
EREVKPIGSNERTRVEARIIAATNQDVEAAVKLGTLRKDLYFRLNVISIKVPPLRQRKSDIPILVHYFMEKYQGEDDRTSELSYEALNRLMSYNWPGNVRELENCIQRSLVLGTGPVIQARDLPSNVLYHVGPAPEDPEISPLHDLERRAILQALKTTGGDRLQAAKLLGIGKTTIYRKLKAYRLKEEDWAKSA